MGVTFAFFLPQQVIHSLIVFSQLTDLMSAEATERGLREPMACSGPAVKVTVHPV
jgi:hypothetical protein